MKQNKIPNIRKGLKIKFRPRYWYSTYKGYVVGTVIWVHPKGRFFMVEYNGKPRPFTNKTPKIRECLYCDAFGQIVDNINV